jgi:hypothetical protein
MKEAESTDWPPVPNLAGQYPVKGCCVNRGTGLKIRLVLSLSSYSIGVKYPRIDGSAVDCRTARCIRKCPSALPPGANTAARVWLLYLNCELAGDIFKAGVWVGVLLVLGIIGGVIWMMSRSRA